MTTIEKTCPRCARRLAERVNRENGSVFLGCTGWPECSHTQMLPASELMRRAGAATLPGFD